MWISSTCVTVVLVMSITLILVMGTMSEPKAVEESLLYPRGSESRTLLSLDGIWNFRLADEMKDWYKKELRLSGATIPMPVPSSYNDITEDIAIRDYAGVVWYDRTVYVPEEWNSEQKRLWIWFGSVNYAAEVYVNGELVANHSGGHVPFQADVTAVLVYGGKNLISVAVDNTLTDITVPQGSVETIDTDEGVKVVQSYTFDFFNYAGIHRPVLLYTTPIVYIDDISVVTDIDTDGNTGYIEYKISAGGQTSENISALVSLIDRDGNYVLKDISGLEGRLQVLQVKLWWPYLMDPDPGYLYTFEVELTTGSGIPEDVYRLPVGVRKLAWDSTSVTINGKPIYIRGFGRHEDSDIRGKGHDFPLIARDYNLIKWLGANAYRTSHYPYSEEIMDFADREGIMIIDECSGININGFKPELLEAHKTSLTRLYSRDKNRPSVIMWSIANEANTSAPGADIYFGAVAEHIKALDPTRPITMAMNAEYDVDLAGQFMDVIGFNRYNGWYYTYGRTDIVIQKVREEAQNWYNKYNKPVIMTEYGADTMPGLHLSPEFMWSEEYQIKLITKHFEAFDELRQEGYFIGEMIWNFADFKTAQSIIRVGGNKKGIFTRERQPKSSANILRKRYWAIAVELDEATPPADLNEYISKTPSRTLKCEL